MRERLLTPSFRSPVRRHGFAPPDAIDTQDAKQELDQFRRTQPTVSATAVKALTVAADSLAGPDGPVRHLLVVEGESGEVPLDELYPSQRVGFVSVGDFLVDMASLNHLDASGIPDPAVIEQAVETGPTQTFILPSTCVEYSPGLSFIDGWRASLRQHLQKCHIDQESYFQILREFATDPTTRLIHLGSCPRGKDGCTYDPKIDNPLRIQPVGELCPKCNAPLDAADALRLTRELEQEASNAVVFSRLKDAMVHLIQWHYVNSVRQTKPAILADTAFVTLRPHAIYGATAAGLKTLFSTRYEDLYASMTQPPMLIGLYTSGPFFDHAKRVDVPPGSLLELTRDYIGKHILIGTQTAQWGKDTHYGWPFIYRTKRGQPCAFTLPQRPGQGTAPADYPEMRRATRVLDAIIDLPDTGETTVPAMVKAKGNVDAGAARSILKELANK